MLKFTYLFLCLLIFLTPKTVLATDDCVFDQENQKIVIATIAKTYPYGKIDFKNRIITWHNKKEGTTIFSYGGCAHLGSSIINTQKLGEQRTREQIFSTLKILVNRFWNNDDVPAQMAVTTIFTALENSSYSVEKINQKTFYRINDVESGDVIISHEYKNGIDNIEISWIGNF
jgi:hypothetical protein